MNLDPTEEQALLRQSLDRLLADHYGFGDRLRHAASPLGWSREVWDRWAALGLLGIGIPEDFGGFGGTVERMIAMEAMGRSLCLEPYLASTVLGATAVLEAGSARQRAAILPAVAAGELRLAWAHAERDARHALAWTETTARRAEGGWALDGAKAGVLHGDTADRIVVSARIAGSASDVAGLGLFLLSGDAAGLERRGRRLFDGTRAADLILRDSRAEALGTVGEGWPAIERVAAVGMAALCAAAAGSMEAVHDLTVAYLGTREQFGRPIGANQALQHRAAEMMVALEQARSMALLANLSLDEPDRVRAMTGIAQAKVVVGRSGRFIAQQAVQLHGGIGVTEEYAAGHHFRFLTVADQLFGDAAHHLDRLAEAIA